MVAASGNGEGLVVPPPLQLASNTTTCSVSDSKVSHSNSTMEEHSSAAGKEIRKQMQQLPFSRCDAVCMAHLSKLPSHTAH